MSARYFAFVLVFLSVILAGNLVLAGNSFLLQEGVDACAKGAMGAGIPSNQTQ